MVAPSSRAGRQEEGTWIVPTSSALSSMLASRWKGGGSGASSAAPGESAPKKDTPKVGQVRTFKIVKLDVEKKKIEVELAS